MPALLVMVSAGFGTATSSIFITFLEIKIALPHESSEKLLKKTNPSYCQLEAEYCKSGGGGLAISACWHIFLCPAHTAGGGIAWAALTTTWVLLSHPFWAQVYSSVVWTMASWTSEKDVLTLVQLGVRDREQENHLIMRKVLVYLLRTVNSF